MTLLMPVASSLQQPKSYCHSPIPAARLLLVVLLFYVFLHFGKA